MLLFLDEIIERVEKDVEETFGRKVRIDITFTFNPHKKQVAEAEVKVFDRETGEMFEALNIDLIDLITSSFEKHSKAEEEK